MGQSIIRRLFKRGIHVYNRYTINQTYTYSQGYFDRSTYYSTSSRISMIGGEGFSFNATTGEYRLTGSTMKFSQNQWCYYSDHEGYQYGIVLSNYSLSSVDQPGIGVAVEAGGTASGLGTSPGQYTETTYHRAIRQMTPGSQTRGTYVDTIVTSNNISNGANADGYWYERIQ